MTNVQDLIVTPLKEKLYCPDCGESGDTDSFEEAVAWNLGHINRHNPQPELTIIIGGLPAPSKYQGKKLARICHLCADSRKEYDSQDKLKTHVRGAHRMTMTEFRLAPAA